MNQQDIVKLNVKRVQIQLKKLLKQLRPEVKDLFTKYEIVDEYGKVYQLSDIDFKKSCIFICNVDFLSLIGVYALQKINNVIYPDTTKEGIYSRIRTDYFIVESPDIRYSKIQTEYDENEVVPEHYNALSYLYKPIALWRLVDEVGIGSKENMYEFCNFRLHERYLRNQIDWIFYQGTLESYRKTYNIPLNYPVYIIRVKTQTKTGKDVF